MARKAKSGPQEIKFVTKMHTVDEKDGRQLKKKKQWDASSRAFIILCMFLMVMMSVFIVVDSITNSGRRNMLNLDYGSVSIQPLNGEKYSDMSGYTAIDVFGRINWTFAHQEKWYSEMHGKVNTVIEQDVSTYKKFNNGILISADITNSSLISNANEFCYLKDQDIVMWRKAAGGSSTYNGFDTPWQSGDPYRKMTISGQDGFKATNGLPAYELSVYVVEEHTVESSTPIVRGEDGLYTVTYTLVPNTWQEEDDGGNLITKGATAYYENQMIFSGGLPEPPSFHSISYTLVFDENWQVFRTDITENYDAKYGPIAANCIYNATTIYEYGTERAESSEFEDYFQDYADGPVDNAPAEKVPTALDCLAEAFGSVLVEPTSLNLNLKVDETPYSGIVNLDLSKADLASLDLSAISAKAKVGPLALWLEEGEAYLNYGGAKLKVNINDLIELLKEYSNGETDGEEQDLLGALGQGEFTYTDTTAELSSVLPLGDFSLPVHFYFLLSEDGVKLDKVTAAIKLGETVLDLELSYGTETLPDLPKEEQSDYAPLVPYAERLVNLFTSDTLRAKISYRKDDLSLEGDLLVSLAGSAQGNLKVTFGDCVKDVKVSYLDQVLYLNLDGIKLSAGINEAIKLIQKYVDLPTDEMPELDLGNVLREVLSDEFAQLIRTTKGEDRLTVSLRGTELLQAFGLDFALGDVTLNVSQEGLGANLLGAELLLSEGEPFEVVSEGYVPVLKYAENLISLFQNQNLALKVDFEKENISAKADIVMDTKALVATSEITIGYNSAQKTLNVLFADGVIYLCVDGIKVSANVDSAVELLSDYIEIPKSDLDARKIVEKLLSLDLGKLATIREEEDALAVAIDGTLLLQTLGLDFALGDIRLEVSENEIKANALGANILITKGEEFTLDKEGYIELVGYAKSLKELLSSGYLHAKISYEGTLAVEGELDFDIKGLVAQANLTLTYKNIKKDLHVIYAEDEVYLSVEGLKVKAKVSEAIAFVKEVAGVPKSDLKANELIEKLLGTNFSTLLSLSETDDTLQVTIFGTELLEALGITFDLGEVKLELDDESLRASALGANITITKGTAFTPDTQGYIELVGYAKSLKELLSSGYLHAQISYEGTLAVEGELDFDIKNLVAQADLTLTYKNIKKDLQVIYAEDEVYLSVEGLKVKANVSEAIDFVKGFVEIPETDIKANELIEKLLGTNFAELLKLEENSDTLQVTIYGTKLLEALGITFELGEVKLELNDNELKADALGADITITKGEKFECDTQGYIELVGYAKSLKELLSSGYLHAQIDYTGDLSVSGTLDFDMEKLVAQADLTLTYKNITKDLHVIYAEDEIYLSVEGLKVKANVSEAIDFVKGFVEIPESDVNANELIEKLLGMDFAELLKLDETDDTLQVTIYGTKLLKALGITFDLGEVKLELDDESLRASALGANITITKGTAFTPDKEGYIELVGYAKSLKKLLSSGYLHAMIEYTGDLTVSGTLDFDMEKLVAQADLTITYKNITKELQVIYAENEVYLSVEGLKVKANVSEAIAFVKEFVEIPESDINANELIEKLLGTDFAELLKLEENSDTLQVTIYGTKLLEALGITFDLGEVKLELNDSELKANALGANITITKGTAFTPDKEGYIELVGYAKSLKELLSSGYLHAQIDYTGDLTVSGTLDFDMEKLVAQADLTLTYKNITKDLHVIYAEDEVYLSVEGLKVKANVTEAIAFVKEFVEIPESDVKANELIEKLLGTNFAELLKLEENSDTLQVTIYGTKLLEALGITFELGEVKLELNENEIKANALGANILITKGEAFTPDKEGYIELVGYAKSLKELLSSGYLHAQIDYTGDLTVSGTLDFDMEKLVAQADLTLTYKNITKDLHVIYAENEVYLSVEGLKVKANVSEAVAFVKEFVEIPESDVDANELIEKLLGTDFEELLKLEENSDTLQVTIYGTKLLESLGITFELGEVKLELDDESLRASALGANITITKGTAFTPDKEGYIELVGYAKSLKELLSSGYLNVKIGYQNGKFDLEGELQFELKSLMARGTLAINYANVQKEIELMFLEKTVYIQVDGLKFSANVEELVKIFASEDQKTESDPETILLNILGMDLSKLLTLTEQENTLNLIVNGTALLKEIGIGFDLGNVALNVREGELSVSAIGAELTVIKGNSFTIGEDEIKGYINLPPYIKDLKDLIESDNFTVSVHYDSDEIRVFGDIQVSVGALKEQLKNTEDLKTIDIKTLLLQGICAKGSLTLQSGEASKNVNLIFKDGTIYLEMDGLKVSLQTEQLLALFEKQGESAEKIDLIEKLLGMKLNTYLQMSEKDGVLSILAYGTELFKYFGLGFAPGEIELKVSENLLSAQLLGIRADIRKGEAFTIQDAETAGYVELTPYIAALKDLIESDNFELNVSYSKQDFKVDGIVRLSVAALKAQSNLDLETLLETLKASAEINVSYKGFTKKIEVSYVGEAVYLKIDDLKIMTDLPTAQETAVASFGNTDAEFAGIIEKLLGLPYGELLELSVAKDEDGVEKMLDVVLHGTKLLTELGSDFELGDVNVTYDKSKIQIKALGAEVSLSACDEVIVDTEGYRDLGAVAKKIVSIVKNSKIFISGEFKLRYEKHEVSLIVNSGLISWENNSLGLELKGKLVALEKEVSFTIRIEKCENGYIIKLTLENLGVKVETSEIGTLTDAFTSLKTRIEEVSDKMVGEGNRTHLSSIPGMETLASLSSASTGGKTVLDILNLIFEDFSIEDLLNGIQFGDPEDESTLLTLKYRGLEIALSDEISEDKMLAAKLSVHKGDFSAEAAIHADATEKDLPAEVETGLCYLEVKHFASLLGQLESAVDILEEQELNYDISGKVVTDGEVRYNVSGKISYSIDGDEVPFKLVEKAIHVSEKLRLAIRLDVAATTKAENGQKKDTSVYLDFWLLDYNPDGKTDGTLDFYVSASTVGRPKNGETLQGYDPIKLYAPSSEIMGVLSGALSVFGMDDIDLLNKYFISKWLPESKSVEQFHALGESLLSTLTQSLGEKIAPVKDILKKLGAFAEKQEASESTAAMGIMPAERGYIKSVETDENSFKLVLNTDVLYSQSGLSDLTVELAKTKGTNGNDRLSKLALSNIYNSKGTEYTCLSVMDTTQKLDATKPSEPKTFTSFDGIDSLLVTLVNSATHETEKGYAVNNNFYIDGSASVSVLKYDVNIHDIGLFVEIDEENKVGVNVHYEVDEKFGTISEDTKMDLSIRGGMVYMRRTVKNEVSYRVMPLNTFTANILDHVQYMLNIPDFTWWLIQSQIKDGQPSDNSGSDVGTKLKQYIKDFTHKNDGNESWTLSLNGVGLTGSEQIGDINVTLNEENDFIRSLNLNLKVAKIFNSFLVDIDANLKWRNPANVMDSGVSNNTSDIEREAGSCMKNRLENKTWGEKEYLEGTKGSVTYSYNGKTLKTQDVIYDKNKEIMGELDLPDVTNIEPGYIGAWKIPNPARIDSKFEVALTPKQYTILFKSDRVADGYTYSEEEKLWIYRVSYTFNGKFPELPLKEDVEKRMTGFTCPTGHVHTKGDNSWHVYDRETICLVAEWEDIIYHAEFNVDGAHFASANGIYGSEIKYPNTPSKKGYTFTGWDSEQKVFESDCTFEAKFTPNVYTFRFVSEYEIKDFAKEDDGKWVKEVSWTYDTALPELPTEANKERKLVGFRCEKGETHTSCDNLPHNLDENLVELEAVWEDIVYTASFYVDSELYHTVTGKYGEEIDYPEDPFKEGYTFTGWDNQNDVFFDNYEIHAKFVPMLYTVTFVSESQVPDWENVNGKYTHIVEMYFGSTIEMKVGDKVTSCTVTGNQTVELPDTSFNSRKGVWQEPQFMRDDTAHTSSAKFETVFKPDHIHYSSEIAFTYEGSSIKSKSLDVDFLNSYALIKPMAEGYTFLGWYSMDSGSWEKIENLTSGAEEKTVNVEALWLSEASLTLQDVSHTSSGFLFGRKDYYSVTIIVNGGELFGAFAKEATIQIDYTVTLSALSIPIYNDTNCTERSKVLSELQSIYAMELSVNVKIRYCYRDLLNDFKEIELSDTRSV